jgi:hypothetical protein
MTERFYEHWTGIPGADDIHARYEVHAVSAAAQQPKPKPAQPDLTDPAYIASVYARWNAPPTSSLRDHEKQ